MTEEKLIDKFKNVKLATEKQGSFYLFALNFDSSVNRWDLLVASDWLDVDSASGIRIISQSIQKSLTRKEQDAISRVVVIPKSSMLLHTIARAVEIGNGVAVCENTNLNGVLFEKAFIFECHLPAKDNDRIGAVLKQRKKKSIEAGTASSKVERRKAVNRQHRVTK